MSVILAVECGGESFSAALKIGGEVRQAKADADGPHSRHALPLVQRLLAEAQMTLSRCDAFAFGAGPGRFSGLRLACGIVQSFGMAADRPVAAVDSLAALAQANYGDRESRAEAALPAHRGHVFAARCRRDGHWQCPRPRLIAADEYVPGTRTRRVCGLAFLKYPEIAERNAAAEFCGTAAEPDARAVAEIATSLVACGLARPASAARPRYIRRRVAQTIAEREAVARESV